MQLGTKAETLKILERKLKHSSVLPQYSFTVRDWKQKRECLLEEAVSSLGLPLVVRSSALSEDTQKESRAGEYDSVIGIQSKQELEAAVEKVIRSYGDEMEENQVLVQPQLESVVISGVAFTLDPNTQGHYYVVEYDDSTGSTESVTSGTARERKLLYIFKNREHPVNEWGKKLCAALRELEELFGENRLDVEFAATQEGSLYIFQVRPLCVNQPEVTIDQQDHILKDMYEKIRRENKGKPFLFGKKTIYGVMPDWNPAEIIGIRPKPLALSLYKEIITDSTWAYQRDNYGYRNLRSFPLLIDFYGLPYIDVRVSFNSFVPKSLRKELGERLVDYYLKRFEENPQLHDKIEFEIAFTCYTLDLPERIQILKQHGFSKQEVAEIQQALLEMTKTIINNEDGLWKKEYDKISILEKRYEEVTKSDLDDIAKIYWLLQDCSRYGTLPFSGLARAGFIAVQLLKSLVCERIITKQEYQLFMSGLSTISSELKNDRDRLSKKHFIKKYGHLRPGTYDICSKRYDEAIETYFDWNEENESSGREEEKELFKLTIPQIQRLQDCLKEHGLPEDVLEFFHFIKTAIEGREYAKFIFTKSLSEAMRLFAKVGSRYGLSEDDCSFANIGIIKQLYASSCDVGEEMKKSIAAGKEKYKYTKTLALPPVIIQEEDVYGFFYPDDEPNYITLKEISGDLCILENDMNNVEVEGKIVMIESADPGFDWIFAHKIRGFITKWGGANSHMAIRANELGIVAAVGVGEKKFEKIKKHKKVQIDGVGKRIQILE